MTDNCHELGGYCRRFGALSVQAIPKSNNHEFCAALCPWLLNGKAIIQLPTIWWQLRIYFINLKTPRIQLV